MVRLLQFFAIIALFGNILSFDRELDLFDDKDRCTAIGVGKKATIDGSTITTHNNDCHECDFRITHVPARDWPKGSKRPVYNIRNSYPRYVENPNSINIHGPDYAPEKTDISIYPWTQREPIAHIDQVPHTYAYTLGTYALQNEKQVSIGESTCAAKFAAKPIYDGGNATVAMETLTEIALERCPTARCAIRTMGAIGEKYGFYGPDWAGPGALDEAGEGLVVADADETWIFHILPDDTGASAIWAAARVPDEHITVIANQFVIAEIDMNDKENFMFSSNMVPIAIKHDMYSAKGNKPFHFSNIFGQDRHASGNGCTRRVWRVFTLAAPSLNDVLSGYTDGLQTFGYGKDGTEPYPFSVKPDQLLTVQDIMNMKRDQFEGTPFDLTTGLDAGPFGDPMRYPARSVRVDPENAVTREDMMAGLGFQRPVALWRTAYSSITQSRKNLPDSIGAVTWIAQYGPHFSTYVPVYVQDTPKTLKTGSVFKLDKDSNWWVHCLTGNYLSRWYVHTIDDVKTFQRNLEARIFDSVRSIETAALLTLRHINHPDHNGTILSETEAASQVSYMLRDFQETTARSILNEWWDFFFTMAGKYRDVFIVKDLHVADFNSATAMLSIPRSWFESIGYWGAPFTPPPSSSAPVPVKPINVPSEDSIEIYKTRYPNGYYAPYSWPFTYKQTGDQAQQTAAVNRIVDVCVGIAVGVIFSLLFMKLWQKLNPRQGYDVLP